MPKELSEREALASASHSQIYMLRGLKVSSWQWLQILSWISPVILRFLLNFLCLIKRLVRIFSRSLLVASFRAKKSFCLPQSMDDVPVCQIPIILNNNKFVSLIFVVDLGIPPDSYEPKWIFLKWTFPTGQYFFRFTQQRDNLIEHTYNFTCTTAYRIYVQGWLVSWFKSRYSKTEL